MTDKQAIVAAAAVTSGSVNDDFVLASLVESGFIIGSIKTVFERGKQQDFQQSLDKFNEKTRKEIQVLCSDHYEEFLKSVAQLKIVRVEASKLRDKINDVNDEVQSAGSLALAAGKELLNSRKKGEHIAACMNTLELCRNLASLSRKVTELITSAKYYPALVTLEQLEREIRKPFYSGFKFVDFVERTIPYQRSVIKTSVEAAFHEWLQQCKKNSQEIGKAMMQLTEQKMMLVRAKQKQQNATQMPTSTLEEENDEKDQLLTSLNHEFVLHTNYDDRMKKFCFAMITFFLENVFESVKLDFTPVYNCKHIFETLNYADNFKSFYRSHRSVRCNSNA